MGDNIDAARVAFTARVLGANPGGPSRTLQVVKNGEVVDTAPVTGPDFVHTFSSTGPGRYGLRVMRGSAPETVGTPIWVGPREPLRVAGFAARRIAVRAGALRPLCRVNGTDARRCAVDVLATVRGRSRRIGTGSALLTGDRAFVPVKLGKAGRALLARRGRRGLAVRLTFRGIDREDKAVTVTRRALLRAVRT